MTSGPATIMWRPISSPGMERCELASTEDGYRLAGTSLLIHDGAPVEIRYSVALDHGFATRIVGVHVRAGDDNRSVALRSDGEGTWEVGGEPLDDLAGALDVDLGWTPATNTLPIRRLALEVGDSAEIAVAYIPFPERVVATRRQTYTRTAMRRYRFESRDFAVDLTVDEHGLVTAYPGMWTAVSG